MFRRRLAVAVLVAVALIPFERLASQAAPISEARAPERSIPAFMSAANVDRDLDALESELKNRPAHLKAARFDYRAAIDSLRARSTLGMDRVAFGVEVLRIVSTISEGRAGVKAMEYPPGDLPFYLESSGDRVVAVRMDRVQLVDPYRPYVTRIDGRPIDEWLSAAEQLVPGASPQSTRRYALRHVQRIQLMRSIMNVPASRTVTIEVATRDGGSRRNIVMDVSPRTTGSIVWPSSSSRVIRGDIGYLRIPLMDAHAATEIATWMPRFSETRGLIIDVRGNAGGNREALRALLPYFISDSAAARPANVFFYGKPVVVLLDEGSNGATEGFLIALNGKDHVTLIGTPSGGPGAPHASVTLPVSQLKVTFTSMAALEPDGDMAGIVGTQPDVLVFPDPDYFLVRGWDAALERAVDHIRR